MTVLDVVIVVCVTVIVLRLVIVPMCRNCNSRRCCCGNRIHYCDNRRCVAFIAYGVVVIFVLMTVVGVVLIATGVIKVFV